MSWETTAELLRFAEAIDWFRRRVPITDAQFQTSIERARKQAFWISGVTQATILRDVFKSLAKAIEKGVPLAEWKKAIGPTLQKAWLGKLGTGEQAARIETVMRNWSQASYGRARWDQMATPAVRKIRPYLLFDGIKDSRQSPICATCNGTLLLASDPWWETHRPPMHHRCRSGLRSLRREQAEERGITRQPTYTGPQQGFGTGDEFKIDPAAFPKRIRPPKTVRKTTGGKPP